MSEPSVDLLRKARKETNKKVHIIDVINGKAFNFKPIFKTEEIALQKIEKDVIKLLSETYDYFPVSLDFNSGMIICVFYHKKRGDLIGSVAVNQYSSDKISYIEIGLSLIASKYQKMGFQSVEARRIREYAYIFLGQGMPFYISARMASAATQLQVLRGRLPNKQGKLVNVAYPKGFVPHYIANKNKQGQFLLEFGLIFDAWPTLDKKVNKTVHLPEVISEKQFQIFNPEHRPDIATNFHPVEENGEDFLIDGTKYRWDDLKGFQIVYGNLKTGKKIIASENLKFHYSEISAPNLVDRSVAIEEVNEFDFCTDVDFNFMKSVNVTVQISDFQNEKNMIANILIIHQLIKNGFTPTCVMDLQVSKFRKRVAIFGKWGKIHMQPYFEFLPEYYPHFQTFWHDCKIQNLQWGPQIELMTSDKLEEKILVERFKSIL